MGKKKGKKGKSQDSGAAPPGAQEQGPQGSSRQEPSTHQPEQEGARGSQQKTEQQQTKPTREASLTHQYGASVKLHGPSKGRGERGRETQKPPQIGAQQPSQDLPQQQQQPGFRSREQISQQTASIGPQQPSQYVSLPYQMGQGGQQPYQGDSAVRQGAWSQQPPLGIPHQPPPGIPAVQQGTWERPAQPPQSSQAPRGFPQQPPQGVPQQPPPGIPAVQQGPRRRPAQPPQPPQSSQTPRGISQQPPQGVPQQLPRGIPAVQQGPRRRPAQPSQPPQSSHTPRGIPQQPPQGVPQQSPRGIPAVQQGSWGRPAQPSQPPQLSQPPRGIPQQPPQGIPQQPSAGIPAVQQGAWGRPAQPPQGIPQQPPEGIPQEPPPGIPAVQQGPWGRPAEPSQPPQPPRGIHQQPPQSIPQYPQGFSPTKQTPQPVQQPKGQKGKHQASKQREGAKQGASSSQGPPTSSLSKVHIGKTETGGGDSQLIPLEYIKAVPGIKGTKINVETNHLSLNLGKLKTAVHYDVNLIPDRPKKFLRYVLEEFRKKHFNNRYPAFDGIKNRYSASLLPFDKSIEDEISIHLADDTPKTYKVEIKFANYVDLTPLHDLLKSKETPREALQVVDIVLRSAPASTCISAGRSFFTKPFQIINLGEGMEMYTGFYQSAIRGWKPFLNVDVSHKAFPKGIKVDQLIDQLSEGTTRSSRTWIDMLSAFITTLRVCYEIPRQASTRRMYTVNGVGTSPRQTTFKLDNEVITIENYYKVHKNYILKCPELPTLWVGSKSRENKILLPLELCTIVEGQVTNRKLTENQTRLMIKETAQDAKIRKAKILASLDQAKHNDHPSVKNEFKFSVGKEFTKVDARILDPPVLMYATNQRVRPSKGVWRNSEFIENMPMNKWTIACVDRYNARPSDLSNLADMLRSSARSTGMTINLPEKPFIHIKSQTLAGIQEYFRNQKSKKYDVIFVIVPNSGPQYSYVKTAAEINVGCLTQCVKSNTISKMREATALNLLLKVNSKLNGVNHCLENKPDIMKRPFMIMGADVTHPSPDARNIPSVAAVTASHDPKAFKYNICWRLQQPKVEIIEDLEAIVVEQLLFFNQQTGYKPETIIFFRDGVSEGQFEQVRNAEIRAIRSACKRIQRTDYEPKITFLVVQKRHHTRLFPLDKKYEDRNFNVPPGTCVDSHITHPFMQDFYLVSHASIKGVARPTKYCTLWDDNSLTNDQIEELTYYLCHMFTRCNRSVSYPAPTYYAHLAAARGKVYIENEHIDMDKLQEKFSKLKILEEIQKEKPMFFV